MSKKEYVKLLPDIDLCKRATAGYLDNLVKLALAKISNAILIANMNGTDYTYIDLGDNNRVQHKCIELLQEAGYGAGYKDSYNKDGTFNRDNTTIVITWD